MDNSKCPRVSWDLGWVLLVPVFLKNLWKDTHIFVVRPLGQTPPRPMGWMSQWKIFFFFGGEISLLPAGGLGGSDKCENSSTRSDSFYRMCFIWKVKLCINSPLASPSCISSQHEAAFDLQRPHRGFPVPRNLHRVSFGENFHLGLLSAWFLWFQLPKICLGLIFNLIFFFFLVLWVVVLVALLLWCLRFGFSKKGPAVELRSSIPVHHFGWSWSSLQKQSWETTTCPQIRKFITFHFFPLQVSYFSFFLFFPPFRALQIQISNH